MDFLLSLIMVNVVLLIEANFKYGIITKDHAKVGAFRKGLLITDKYLPN